MTKYEYTWDDSTNYHGIVVHSELLQKRSDEGWEMVAALAIDINGTERIRFYWKRLITP